MTIATMTERKETALEFVEAVKNLKRGELALLKRNAGNTLSEARGVPGSTGCWMRRDGSIRRFISC